MSGSRQDGGVGQKCEANTIFLYYLVAYTSLRLGTISLCEVTVDPKTTM